MIGRYCTAKGEKIQSTIKSSRTLHERIKGKYQKRCIEAIESINALKKAIEENPITDRTEKNEKVSVSSSTIC